MTEPQTHDLSTHDLSTHDAAAPGTAAFERPARPTLLGVLRVQRKTVLVALVLIAACFVLLGAAGEWQNAALTSVGILLALANHVASELWLGRLISSGEEPTRGAIAGAAFTRLAVLSVVAVAAAVVFWPNGIGLLLGLAIFRLIALVMTTIPLLKELKNHDRRLPDLVRAASDIEIGNHVEGHLGGLTFNLDTIWTTLLAGGIVVALGFWARARLTAQTTDHVPTKIQLVWEAIIKQVTEQVEDSLGRVNPFVVPLAVALFFFILIANWFELVPSEPNHTHLLPSPTADTNLTYALALFVIVGVWTYGIREKGVKGYFKHFLEPFPILLPLNLIEELIKPVTLALRLFGNIFAGGIMLSLIGLIPIYLFWAPNIIWKLFDMFIGGIQAFIFALLTVLYFGMAGAGHSDDHDEANERPAEQDDDHRPADAVEVDTERDHVRKPEPAAAH